MNAQLVHQPCQGDAGGEWVHCGCHDSDCLWEEALTSLLAEAEAGRAVLALEATGHEWRIEARAMSFHVWAGVMGRPASVASTLQAATAAALQDEATR